MNTMGIDIGTSGCKAVVFDENGKQLAAARSTYPLLHPEPGAAELEPDVVVQACMTVIRQAAGEAGQGTVAALAISSQGEAFTAVSAQGNALCNAMVSSDLRATTYAERWPSEFGLDRLYAITGHTAHPMFTLFKFLWLRDHRPQIWKDAARFLCFEDLLHMRLGLPPTITWPLAGRTMLFDVRQHQWDPDILAAIGLDASRLAQPRPSGHVVGKIPANLVQQLGLADGAMVVTGGHDQPCAALGSGAIQPGSAMYATGTVECITPTLDGAVFSNSLRDHNLCTYDHTLTNRYATVAFSLTGGNLLTWFKDTFGVQVHQTPRQGDIDPYELLLQEAGDEPSPLLVLPYWTPSGTPYFDTHTPGMVTGWRMQTTRGQFIRALLEGVAFEMRLNLQILDNAGCSMHQLHAVGGGAQSRRWTQLKADVTGRPIHVMQVNEAGCLGAAMLARAALDGVSVEQIVPHWVKTTDIAQPSVALTKHYHTRFQEYQKLYSLARQSCIV